MDLTNYIERFFPLIFSFHLVKQNFGGGLSKSYFFILLLWKWLTAFCETKQSSVEICKVGRIGCQIICMIR